MVTSSRWRLRGAGALALSLIPVAAPAPATTTAVALSHRDLPDPPPAGQVRAELDQLVVEAPHSMEGYSRAWTDVKYVYGLSVTGPEKVALNEMLDTCPQ